MQYSRVADGGAGGRTAARDGGKNGAADHIGVQQPGWVLSSASNAAFLTSTAILGSQAWVSIQYLFEVLKSLAVVAGRARRPVTLDHTSGHRLAQLGGLHLDRLGKLLAA